MCVDTVQEPLVRPANKGEAQSLPSLKDLWHSFCTGERARPLRFALTGVLAAAIQLVLLNLLVSWGWSDFSANILAFLLSAQVNFLLSTVFTWSDRRTNLSLGRRWVAFHCSIAAMAVVNQLVFVAVRPIVSTSSAALAGIAVAAIGNFALGDRLIFRQRTPLTPQP